MANTWKKIGRRFGIGKWFRRYYDLRWGDDHKWSVGHYWNGPKTSYFTDIFQRILTELNSIWRKDPDKILIFRINYESENCRIVVKNKELILFKEGGTGNNWNLGLEDYPTIEDLKVAINSKTGYSVIEVNNDYDTMNPLSIVEKDENINQSNGDHIFVHTNYNWTFFKSLAYLLDQAYLDMLEMFKEMYITTSTGIWLDFWATFFIEETDRRRSGETDEEYRLRILNALQCNKLTIPNISKGIDQEFPDTGEFQFIEITENFNVLKFSMGADQSAFCGVAKYQDYDWNRMRAFIINYESQWNSNVAVLVNKLRAGGIKPLFQRIDNTYTDHSVIIYKVGHELI